VLSFLNRLTSFGHRLRREAAMEVARPPLTPRHTNLEGVYGAVLAVVLHDRGRYPDTAMSVVIGDPSRVPPWSSTSPS
jgi:hypothetical protein